MLESSFSEKLQRLAIASVPTVLTIVLMAFTKGFLGIEGFNQVLPRVTVICIFYWTLFYPALMPYAAVFLIGFIEDSISGSLFGLTCVLLIMVRYLTGKWLVKITRFGFMKIWIGFALLAILVTTVEYTAVLATSRVLVSLEYPLMQTAFTILAYPVLHVFLTFIHSVISRRR